MRRTDFMLRITTASLSNVELFPLNWKWCTAAQNGSKNSDISYTFMVFELVILFTHPSVTWLIHLVHGVNKANLSEISFDAVTFAAQPSVFTLTGHSLHVSWIEFESTVSTSPIFKNRGGIVPAIFMSSSVPTLNSNFLAHSLNALFLTGLRIHWRLWQF